MNRGPETAIADRVATEPARPGTRSCAVSTSNRTLPLLVAESRAETRTRVDVPGAVLITGALMSLVYGLLQTAETGWGHADSTIPLILATLLGAAFAAVEARTAEPLVPLSFLTVRPRAVASVVILLFSLRNGGLARHARRGPRMRL